MIVDDTAAVWPGHADNLLLVERYCYFPSSARQLGSSHASLMRQGRSGPMQPAGPGRLLMLHGRLLAVPWPVPPLHSGLARCGLHQSVSLSAAQLQQPARQEGSVSAASGRLLDAPSGVRFCGCQAAKKHPKNSGVCCDASLELRWSRLAR